MEPRDNLRRVSSSSVLCRDMTGSRFRLKRKETDLKTIQNKTARPMRVPLPRGKTIHLGPHKTGEIADRASEHPPLVKLVEAGDLEIIGEGASQADPRKASLDTATIPSQGRHGAAAATRRTGDR